MSRWIQSIGFSLATALLGVAILISPLGIYVEREFGLGWLFTLRGPIAPPDEVAVVGINSRSGADRSLIHRKKWAWRSSIASYSIR